MNLSLNTEVKRLMKMHCAGINKDVSEITEQLYRRFLRKHGIAIPEIPEPKRSKKRSSKDLIAA